MSEYQPLVSIGIPTYSRPDELTRTLEGVTRQTYQNLEIIVSDNASEGGAVDSILHKFMKQDSRIKYFRQTENRGALFNFQFVLHQSTGEFFMWAADDDYRAPTFVEVLVDLMSSGGDAAIAFCDFIEVDESGAKVEGYPRHLPLLRPFTSIYGLIRLSRFFFQLESKGKANLIYGLMRRSALIDFEWNEFVRRHGSYGADMLFVFAQLCKGKLVLADQCLYRCTVGNKKEYVVVKTSTFAEKLASVFAGLAEQLRYSAQYLTISKGWVRMALIVCWPIKALDIIVRIFLATEIRNFYMRVLRLCKKARA